MVCLGVGSCAPVFTNDASEVSKVADIDARAFGRNDLWARTKRSDQGTTLRAIQADDEGAAGIPATRPGSFAIVAMTKRSTHMQAGVRRAVVDVMLLVHAMQLFPQRAFFESCAQPQLLVRPCLRMCVGVGAEATEVAVVVEILSEHRPYELDEQRVVETPQRRNRVGDEIAFIRDIGE